MLRLLAPEPYGRFRAHFAQIGFPRTEPADLANPNLIVFFRAEQGATLSELHLYEISRDQLNLKGIELALRPIIAGKFAVGQAGYALCFKPGSVSW
ncbi:hypothetical protein IV102_02050 [bacterium]|nr:hypothetical protein [bacterium]